MRQQEIKESGKRRENIETMYKNKSQEKCKR
jgi:hypothetical protein